jgi:acetoin utilization deacetylase AcuC-like enzyme
MSTLYIAHPASLDHQTPIGHPERPDRIRAIERALEKERFTSLIREQAPMAEMESLALAHPEDYIVRLRDITVSSSILTNPSRGLMSRRRVSQD